MSIRHWPNTPGDVHFGTKVMTKYSYRNYEIKRYLVLSRFFKQLRFFYILFCIILLIWARPYLAHSSLVMAVLFILVVIYSIFRYLKRPNIYLNRYAAMLLDCLDFIFIGGLVYLTGGAKSFYHMAYCIPILACTVRFGLRAGLYSLCLSAALTVLNAVLSREGTSFPAIFFFLAGLGTIAFSIWTVSVLVNEELRLREELYNTSVTDHLTGLFHSGYMRERIAEEIRRSRRQGGSFAIAFLDLDRFKTVNDRCGHTTGDEVLKHVASIFHGAVRGGETLSRYGGDEFLLLMPGADCAQAEQALRRMRDALQAQPYYLDKHPLRLGVSGGAAEFPREGQTLEQLLSVADQKMYHQKG